MTDAPTLRKGHCNDPKAWAEFHRQYDEQIRSYPHFTDFQLANEIFMVDRNSLGLIGLQTAAKERIRWLSLRLAAALDRIELADELIKELQDHEGAEGWSATLYTKLSTYDVRYWLNEASPQSPTAAPAEDVAADTPVWDPLKTYEDVRRAEATCTCAEPGARRTKRCPKCNPSPATISGRIIGSDADMEHHRRTGAQLPKDSALMSTDFSELEARVLAQLIEEGKYYETRDGRIIGPMRPAINGWRAYNGFTSFTWHPDGCAARGTINPGDLVKEAVWPGPGTEPHDYAPDIPAMGDCITCGHVQDAHTRYQPKEKKP